MPSAKLSEKLKPAKKLLRRLVSVSPREPKITVGLDIGSTFIKMVALGARKGFGNRPILEKQVIPFGAGDETDPTEAIKTALSALTVPVKSVNVSVSGQWVIMRVVEMPTMKPAETKQALPFEAQRYLPFNVKEVVIDGVVLGPSEGNKQWVLIVACKKELLERRIDWVKRAGVEPAVIDVDALALANAFLASKDGGKKQGTHAIMDIGAQLTNVVVLKGETPYLVRDVPWGAEKLTRHLAGHLGKEPEAVAEELRQESISPEVQSGLKLTVESLVTELQLSFDYFENRFGQPPSELLVSGGLSQCNAFLDALKGCIAQPVSGWMPSEGLSGQFAVAYGLALRTK